MELFGEEYPLRRLQTTNYTWLTSCWQTPQVGVGENIMHKVIKFQARYGQSFQWCHS